MCSLAFKQKQLEEQPFANYIDSFDYILRGELVKIAVLSYEYESEVDNMCYHISAIRYLVLDKHDRFLRSPEDLSAEEDDDIQEYFCMLQDYNPNEESSECWY